MSQQQQEIKMAYFTQEMKKNIEPAIKSLLKEFNLKGSLSVQDFSVITLKISQGCINFEKDRLEIFASYNKDNCRFNENAKS
jgi:hypothetical protein